jgi:hypothetical protein
MSSSKLRRPNFNLSGRISNDVAWTSSATRISAGAGCGTPSGSTSTTASTSAQSLVNYTRLCHKRLASSSSIQPIHNRHKANDDEVVDDGQDHYRATTNTEGSKIGVDENNNITTINNNTPPNLEHSVILLEPILEIFQTSCIQNDKAKRKQQKQQRRQFSHEHEGGRTEPAMTHNNKVDNEEEDDEDEIPPQLLRAAKFFPYRFIPMKRALLRSPPLPLPSTSRNNGRNQEYPTYDTSNAVSDSVAIELNLHYRLRLARACWKRGLVAAAEYESLQKSMECTTTSKKRKRRNQNDEGGAETMKKKFNDCGSLKGDDEGHENNNNLKERIRLSLLRLPTEAIHPHRSISAWNHAKDMISQCNALWKTGKETELKEPVRNDDKPQNDAKSLITPNQVADWAMTSWTALLLVRGLDGVVAVPKQFSPSTNARNPHQRDDSLSSIETQLATLLTKRNTSTDALARAVECRLNTLLRPENIQSLNGIHIYSLGKLLASFYNRDDAILHIAISVCCCAIEKGGMSGLEQLARLLAVFLCCLSSTSASPPNANEVQSISIVKDVESILRAKLDDNEFMKMIVDDTMDSAKGRHCPSVLKRKAMSFLQAVFSSTSHLVKCCE